MKGSLRTQSKHDSPIGFFVAVCLWYFNVNGAMYFFFVCSPSELEPSLIIFALMTCKPPAAMIRTTWAFIHVTVRM